MTTGAVPTGVLTGPAGPPNPTADAEQHRRCIAEAVTRMAACGELDLPLPGAGRTRARWEALTRWAQWDLSLARLAEGHTDAIAILAELDSPDSREPPAGGGDPLWGSLGGRAARLHIGGAPGARRVASVGGETVLLGRPGLHARPRERPRGDVAASVRRRGRAAGRRSAAGQLARPGHGGQRHTGRDLRRRLGRPARRAGRLRGAPRIPPRRDRRRRVLARGARAVARTLLAASRKWDLGPHALAHLGAVDARLATVDALLDRVAAAVDADPDDKDGVAHLRAMRVRAAVEDAADDVLRRVGRALGATPLGHDAVHARAVADLTVYLRQHHAERDLADLGRAASAARLDWEDV